MAGKKKVLLTPLSFDSLVFFWRRKEMSKKKVANMIKFPQVRIFVGLGILAIVMVILSYILGNGFWASFCSNIAAGLFTGLVLCFISGSKSSYLLKLDEKIAWLNSLHLTILEYNDLHAKYFAGDYIKENEYEFVYDMGAHANWINEKIIQSQFHKRNHFNGLELCKELFMYNAEDNIEKFAILKDKIVEDDWNKKEVIAMFEEVDKLLWKLNHDVLVEIERIEAVRLRSQMSWI